MGRLTFPGMKPSKGGAYSAKSVKPFRVATDPPVADDAPCVTCGSVRPPLAVAHRDPFCRRSCCETHYCIEPVSADRTTRELAA